ncbi:hypothetical protein DESC_460153 [Desulfosarcina cetonica]|nr:hypothetical protein DESC_460153 [Desulfosarcina cetonica]
MCGAILYYEVSIDFDGENYYLFQLTIFNSGTRINSFSLLVTSVQSIEIAWAAISMSRAPIGVPCFFKLTLRSPLKYWFHFYRLW